MNALATAQVDDFLSWGVRKADHSDIQCKYYVITYILVQDSFYPRTGYAGAARSSALVNSQETFRPTNSCVLLYAYNNKQ